MNFIPKLNEKFHNQQKRIRIRNTCPSLMLTANPSHFSRPPKFHSIDYYHSCWGGVGSKQYFCSSADSNIWISCNDDPQMFLYLNSEQSVGVICGFGFCTIVHKTILPLLVLGYLLNKIPIHLKIIFDNSTF